MIYLFAYLAVGLAIGIIMGIHDWLIGLDIRVIEIIGIFIVMFTWPFNGLDLLVSGAFAVYEKFKSNFNTVLIRGREDSK